MAKTTLAQLRDLVATCIADEPYPFEEHVWAAHHQEWWCEKLGISPATLWRYISKPPFQREHVTIDGRTVALLREGNPGPVTKRRVAKIMVKIWRQKFNREVSKKDFGRLNGLAEDWGLENAPNVFKFVLDNWPAFMAGVKLALAEEQAKGKAVYYRYYEYPSISVMRRFWTVAPELMLMAVQAEGKLDAKTGSEFNAILATIKAVDAERLEALEAKLKPPPTVKIIKKAQIIIKAEKIKTITAKNGLVTVTVLKAKAGISTVVK